MKSLIRGCMIALMLALGLTTVVSATSGPWNTYIATTHQTNLNSGEAVWEQSANVFHRHHGLSNVELDETSQWVRYVSGSLNPRSFTFRDKVYNDSTTYFTDFWNHSLTIGQLKNQVYDYVGGGIGYITVQKTGADAHAWNDVTSELGTAIRLMQKVWFVNWSGSPIQCHDVLPDPGQQPGPSTTCPF